MEIRLRKILNKSPVNLPNHTILFRKSMKECKPMDVFNVTLTDHSEAYLMKISTNFFMNLLEKKLYKFNGQDSSNHGYLHHNHYKIMKISSWKEVTTAELIL